LESKPTYDETQCAAYMKTLENTEVAINRHRQHWAQDTERRQKKQHEAEQNTGVNSVVCEG
jgi:hypothetical protein